MLVLVVTATTVLGLPQGAPEQACADILPLGHTTPGNMATGAVPFTVDISSLNNGYIHRDKVTEVSNDKLSASL